MISGDLYGASVSTFLIAGAKYLAAEDFCLFVVVVLERFIFFLIVVLCGLCWVCKQEQVPTVAEGGGSLELELRWSRVAACGWWECNLGPLHEHSVLLTTETSPQPQD